MTMKPIYLTERERLLAWRLCDWIQDAAMREFRIEGVYNIERPALLWFAEDVTALREKFAVKAPKESP